MCETVAGNLMPKHSPKMRGDEAGEITTEIMVENFPKLTENITDLSLLIPGRTNTQN